MAPRGTKPKTAAQRSREGGTTRQGAISHRRQPKGVTAGKALTKASDIQRPTFMSPYALECWDEAVKILSQVGVVELIDSPALEMMCMHYGFWRAAIDVLKEQGSFALGSTSQPTDHPAMRQAERHSAAYLRFAGEFGLTTLARTRLGMELAKRDLVSSLNERLGPNPRKTNRTPAA